MFKLGPFVLGGTGIYSFARAFKRRSHFGCILLAPISIRIWKSYSMKTRNWLKTACAVGVLSLAAAIAAPAQDSVTFALLHSFEFNDGAYPYAGLIEASDGNLYGTTLYGGNQNSDGTVFEITPAGQLTTIYRFCSLSGCADGLIPYAGLVQASDGTFYGTTSSGNARGFYGTVFRITASGALTTLHTFTGYPRGEEPYAGLVQAPDGSFYGTTYEGGSHSGGTVFKISPGGTLTTLYNFGAKRTDGDDPAAALILATDGNFCGTTVYSTSGFGTVFKMTSSGTLSILHSFDLIDGAFPYAALVQGSDGNFYGTTSGGGADGYGTVFRITPDGVLTTLHSFDLLDGATSYAGLIQGTDGNFYGTTTGGGANGDGTIFKITPDGTLTTLHSFNGTDGGSPYAPLVQDTNGTLYGTTYQGGAGGQGTVFELNLGLNLNLRVVE
jgi:uncharacterized repeat protein (TIGR03803 family)